jgi:dienelactone hydrolase
MNPLRECDGPPKAVSTTRRGVIATLVAGGTGVLGPLPASVVGRRQGDATLELSPQTAQYDEALDIRVSGVAPDSQVTVTARAEDRDGTTWASFARFRANADGTVSVASQEPVAGTYEGVNPMGLVWSMRSQTGTGSVFIPPEGGNDLTVAARVDGDVVAQGTVTRRFGPADLVVEESPDGLVGAMFRPEGNGPFPGVVALHGSGGNPDKGAAILLASHGYAVFAPQYFGAPEPLPDVLAEVPVEYLDRAREWMEGLPAVDNGPMGLVGTSKGAEYALLGGATYDWVGAVAALAPSGVVWAGLTQGQERTSSWSLDGDPVPYVPTAFPPSVVADYLASWPLGKPVSLRPTYEVPLDEASSARIEDATIAVEDIDGPVTLVAGGDDALWPSVRLGRIAAKRLRANDHQHTVRFLTYPAAGHGISYPYQPTTGITSIPGFPPGTSLALGGTPAALARGARESWPEVLTTLAEGLR